MKQPNILFLFSDQHNARCLSCAGHPDIKTPNLDRLAREGTRFTNAYASNPICTPSRISFLSSLYPSTHGYYGLYGHEPGEAITSVFSFLGSRGYRTGALGKLHTPRYWIERHCQFVYDEFTEYPKYLEAVDLYDRNDSRGFLGDRSGETSYLPLEHSCEVALARQVTRFIRNEGEPRDRGRGDAPWFAWISFSRPHEPWTPSEPFASMYPADSLTLPPISESERASVREARAKLSEPHLRRQLAAYLCVASQVDYSIGLVIEELKRLGELQNTVVVYASDHGDYAGEHGLMEKAGGISYRAITRVPLIVWLPGQEPRGQVRDEIVESVDVFPTLCELAGLAVPNTAQGRSFANLLHGGAGWMRQNALTENPYRKALNGRRWRYVANLDAGQEDELYDLESDPWELQNRIHDPQCGDVAAELLRSLLGRVVRARKPITTINGNWHSHAYDDDGRIDLAACGPLNAYW